MKRLATVQKILGLLLMVFSVTMLPPVVVSLIYGDGGGMPFIYAFLVILGTGLVIWLPVARTRQDLRVRDGFLVVVCHRRLAGWRVRTFSCSCFR